MIKYKFDLISSENDNYTYNVSIAIPLDGFIDDVYMNIVDGDSSRLYFERKDEQYAYFNGMINLSKSALYKYYFTYTSNKENRSFYDYDGLPFKMSVGFSVPDWAKGKIMYHIFVDRFNKKDSNIIEMPRRDVHEDWNDEPVIGPNRDGIWNCDFYGGNFKGIIDKLDYIKGLGVSILYLSPVVKSQSNHRYDTGDYEDVDPYLGSIDDFKLLCSEAHKRGMKVILDAVFNHTGNDSKYFNQFGSYNSLGAYQSDDSPYASFYRKNNGLFDYWWGMDNLPICNGNSQEWIDYITGQDGVIDKWFSWGVDGLRLDVADELTDSFIEKIREAVKRNKEDGFILGEVWKNPMKMNRGYISSGRGMDTVMNYSLIDALIRYYKYCDIVKLKNVLSDIIADYPTDTINSLMNFTSTHDISRVINIFGSNAFDPNREWAWDVDNGNHNFLKNSKLSREEYLKALEIYKSYLFALTFLPGNLSIFYGDEAGVEGLGNLLNRKPFPWEREDENLINYFRFIGSIREDNPSLEDAKLRIRELTPNYFAFERIGNNERYYVVVSRTPFEGEIYVPSEYIDSPKMLTLKKSSKEKLDSYGAIAIKR